MKKSSDRHLIEKVVMENQIDQYFSDWTQLAFSLVTYEKGEIIQQLEEPLLKLKFCVSGQFEVSSCSADGKYFIMSVESAPNLFSDMEFAAGYDHTVAMNAIALTTVVCLEINLKTYRDLLLSDVIFLRYLCQTVSKKALSTGTQYESLVQQPIERRLCSYILMNSSQTLIRLHWGEVSQLLGISYRHLMRLLQSFCDKGILKRGNKKGEYIILDRKILKDMSIS